MIALIEAHRAGLYARAQWLPNLWAGVIVGVVALPLAMAFAIASGARPEQGLYTAIVGGALVSMFGGSRLQVAGPTGAFVAILAGITARYGVDGLQIATLMAGVMLLAMGMARMGGVIQFMPAPVVVGFTAGIAVIIFVGQMQGFLGLPKLEGTHFHEKLWHLTTMLPQTHAATAMLGFLGLALALIAQRLPGLRRLPGPLIAMVVVTAVHRAWQPTGVATIGSTFGDLPTGLPPFGVPHLSIAQVLTLIGPAFTIAMLGAIESLLSAVVADGMAGTRHDSNQELIGQGIANIAAPLFGGFAATGAIARTATSIRNGATNPLAGVVHALTLAAVLLVLAPLASSIPLTALSAILFVVAWNMAGTGHFAYLLRTAPAADRVILVITFALTVSTDLVVAVNVGVLLAVLHFLRRMSEAVETRLADAPSLQSELMRMGIDHLPADVLVYEVQGPMFFGAVTSFERALLHTGSDPRTLVIRLRQVPFMDATGIQTLQKVMVALHQRGVRVQLCEANARVLVKLRRAGLLSAEKSDAYLAGFDDVARYLHAETRLGTPSTGGSE